VIKDTSALTFMIAGIIKEMITIMAAVAVFHDHFGWLNGLGLGIAIFGVALFNLYKLRRLRTEDVQEIIVVRRPSGTGGGGGGGMSPIGEGPPATAKGVEMMHAAALVQRANSRNGNSVGAARGGGAWRHDAGAGAGSATGGVVLERRRPSGSLSGSGGSIEEDDLGVLEHEPLLTGGGRSG